MINNGAYLMVMTESLFETSSKSVFNLFEHSIPEEQHKQKLSDKILFGGFIV